MGLSLSSLKLDLQVLAKDVGTVISEQTAKVVSDPVGVVQQIVSDTQTAILGKQPDLVTDLKNIIEYPITLAESTALSLFNALPGMTTKPVFTEQPGSISGGAGKVVVNQFMSGASLGDLSWLIYSAKEKTNPAITSKWKVYQTVETTSGYDSTAYVDAANKQVAITLEGTQSNSDLSPLWLSKDGVADLQIGLGVIPPQMMEGYQKFKTMVADVQHTFAGYGISVAGHSLGGGLAQMMSGMYFIDTGVALPTIAEAGPGMLGALKEYAEEQLLAGNTIHLPSGSTIKLSAGTSLDRLNQAKAIVSTFQSQQFSNIINLITEQDPVGHINYNADPSKDNHVGIDVIVPAILTPREDLQDVEYTALLGANSLNIVTPDMQGILSGLSNISATRFDRHEPDQSDALWSGTAVGLKQFDGDIGLGTAVFRSYGTPTQVWDGIQTNIPEVEIFGTSTGQTIQVGQYVKDKQNALYIGGNGNDVVIGSNNGDMLIGGSGSSYIFGGNGDNYISGGTGNSLLYGGSGNDIIYAGTGNCYLNGGGGSNLLIGGTGHDTFYWGGTANNLMYNGQAGGSYDFIIAAGATGNSQIKWERNFTNIGSSQVKLQGALSDGSYLLFNFADEIRMADMQWLQSGNDITLVDKGGTQTGAVTFSNAVTAFAQNNGKLDFKFTNGSLYTDDQVYHVVAGTGTLTAAEGNYAGNIMVSGAGNNTVTSGKGNDWIFGGAGTDVFVFNNDFGNDHLVSSNCADTVKFNNIFNASEYSLIQSGDSLVIDYRQTGTTKTNELVLDNWFACGDRVNQFAFNDGMYTVKDKQFVKVV